MDYRINSNASKTERYLLLFKGYFLPFIIKFERFK